MQCSQFVPLGFIVVALSSTQVGCEKPQPTMTKARPEPARQPSPGEFSNLESDAPLPTGRIHFRESAAAFGIAFQFERGDTGEYWLPETMGGGVCVFDFDGDSSADLFFTNGRNSLDSTRNTSQDRLYWSRGANGFFDVSLASGVADRGYGMGCTAGDFDNDGFPDIIVTNVGSVRVFHNQGDGTFRDVAADAGVVCSRWNTSCAMTDIDRDGDLDVFVATYVIPNPRIHCKDSATQTRKYCGPDYYDSESDYLYRNNGDGSFADISPSAGIDVPEGKGLGVVAADFQNDGWPDLFVTNDLRPNFLFDNRGALPLAEIGGAAGVAVNGEGVREANMGIACGDFDGNGFNDLYVTHYYMEHDTLFRNLGTAGFVDATHVARLAAPTRRMLSWGTMAGDYDLDGLLDIFVTSGHINDLPGTGIPYAMPAQLYRNAGGLRFDDVSRGAGTYFQRSWVGRGAAHGDLDGDGDLDIVVVHHHKPAAVLENQCDNSNRSIRVRLVGRRSNRTAVNAQIRVRLPDGPQTPFTIMREIIGGGSYLSTDSTELVIGIGPRDSAESVHIRWPSGIEMTVPNVPSGKPLTVFEPLDGVDVHSAR